MIIHSKVPFTGKMAGIRVWQSGDKLIGALINKNARAKIYYESKKKR